MSDEEVVTEALAQAQIDQQTSILALVLIGVAIFMSVVGFGWWWHPGAGLAVGGVEMFITGVLIGRE